MVEPVREAPRQSLQLGRIIAESFAILWVRWRIVLLVGFVPSLLGTVLPGWAIGFDLFFTESYPADATVLEVLALSFAEIPIFIICNGLITASVVQLAYDHKLGRELRPWQYLRRTFRTLFHNVLLSTLVGVLVIFGLLAVLLPGIWIAAVLSVDLSRFYRWPLAGLIFGIMLVEGGSLFAVDAGLASLVENWLGFAIVIHALANLVVYGWISVVAALVYIRLREIKDGVGVDDLVSVFE